MTTTDLMQELAAAIAAGNRALAHAATQSTPDEVFAPPARPMANVVACVSVPSRSQRGLLHVVAIIEAGPDDYGYVCAHCPGYENRNWCWHCSAAEELWHAHLDSLELFDDGPVDFDAPEPWETNQRTLADDALIDAVEYAGAGCAIGAVVEPDDGFDRRLQSWELAQERTARQERAYAELFGEVR